MSPRVSVRRNRPWISVPCAVLLSLAGAFAAGLRAEDATAEIRAATDELGRLREENSRARRAAADRLGNLEAELARLRGEARDLTKARELSAQSQREQRAERERLARVLDSLRASHRSLADNLPVAGTNAVPASPRAWSGTVAALDAEFTLLTRGSVRPGSAVDPSGRVLDGAWHEAGALAIFASSSLPGGALGQTRGYLEPADALPLPPAFAWQPGAADWPADLTGGRALAAANRPQGWLAHLAAGGPVMLPIGAVAVLSVLLALAKAIALLRLRARDDARVLRVADHLRSGRLPEAAAEANAAPHPLATVLQGALPHHAAPREHLEEVLHERVLAELPALEKHLGTLAVLCAVAPLLGLLGTVTGMIHTFGVMNSGNGRDTAGLAGGISEALITTEAGLVIAIPVLIVQALLSRRVRLVIGDLERAVILLVNRLKEGGAA